MKYFTRWHLSKILFLVLLGLSGTSAQGLILTANRIMERNISSVQTSHSLKEVLRLMENEHNVRFMYDPESINEQESKEIDLEVLKRLEGAISETQVNQTLEPFVLSAKKIDGQYFLIQKKAGVPVSETDVSLSSLIMAQVTVKGQVRSSEDQLGVPAVAVKIKGTTHGTLTDAEGRYSLSQVESNSTLIFSSIGFLTQEVAVGSRTQVDVVLVPDHKQLDEVVVVGYGTQKKSTITGAIATFNAKDLDERPINRVDQALVGQMAGVRVAQTTGVPGKGLSVQVRGSGSITASNEPLYVIDGFPLAVNGQNSNGGYTNGNPLDNINPNDIESIQVLKDASASAIYGSRAANGVVLISTKKGKSGAPKINVNVFTGLSKSTKKIDLLSGEEWMARATEMINSRWVASGAGRTASQSTEERRRILGLKEGAFNTQLMLDDRWAMAGHPGLSIIDWQNELFRTGSSTSYQVGVSGGTDIVKYYVSANYANQEGVILNQRYRPISGRANIDIKPTKRLTVGMNVAPTYSELFEPGHGGGSTEGKDAFLHRALIFSPVAEDTMGVNVNAFNNESYRWGTTNNSSAAIARETIGNTKNFRTLATVYGDYELIKNLHVKTTLNLDNTDASTKKFTPHTVNGNLSSRINTPGEITRGTYSTYRLKTFVNENTLNYNTTIKARHDISALAGFSYNFTSLDASNMASSGGFTNIYVTTLNGAAAITGNTTESENKMLSWFGRLQYAYDSKYLLSASIRRDGSSRFGVNAKWGWFPSVSAGWKISEENFLKDIDALSELKIRGSWGKSGNNNIGDYTSISTLGNYNYSFAGSQAGGLAPDIIADPDLSWEKSNTWNVGIDAGLVQNRIYASFDYYTKKNTDLLLYVPTVAASGFGNMLTNIGAVNNKGWEAELTTRNLAGAFQWTTTMNLSYNTNKILKLGANNSTIEIPLPNNYSGDAFTVLQVGLPINSISVIHRNGILTEEDINNGAAIVPGQQAGDPRYVDVNQDGVINAADRQISGHPNPNYIWGINNSFRFKSFDLSVLLQGQSGGSLYSLLGRAIDVTGVVFADNQLGIHRDRWTAENPDPDAPRGKATSSNFSPVNNTDWLYSTNYWRIRNITAGYNIKSKTPFFQSVRIYMTLENWFGRDKYYGGYNPEAQTTNVSGDSKFPVAADYGGMPLPKSFVAGINVTF
ncbi:SusC/RagA family TonB-linked outer membrane protein [Arcticibacter sp.]|uniref:SusC/RagA family TonB-linked outer membrane protein n=1 Tax=Arcticibacter sp. TaxID=1872630 RepID=UPI00388FB28E